MTCDRCLQPLHLGEHGWMKCPLEPRPQMFGVIDDQLEGGARWCDTMGHEPVWLDGTKSQWKREVEARGLINVDRHDRAYYQRKFRQHDEELRDTGGVR